MVAAAHTTGCTLPSCLGASKSGCATRYRATIRKGPSTGSGQAAAPNAWQGTMNCRSLVRRGGLVMTAGPKEPGAPPCGAARRRAPWATKIARREKPQPSLRIAKAGPPQRNQEPTLKSEGWGTRKSDARQAETQACRIKPVSHGYSLGSR